MQKVLIDLAERSYPVMIGEKLIDRAGELLEPFISGQQVCIVSNEVVAPLYLESLQSQLSSYNLSVVILPDGEQYKNLENLNKIFDTLLKDGHTRSTTLIALGGGVVGDMVGFAASSYMRGVNFIQVPTTVLAQVDSSVGGKTAVNHPLGKNMIGAFYQPKCVLADVSTLKTLSARELSAGLAEVIKYGLIIDPEFYVWLRQNMAELVSFDTEALTHAVKVSCEAKAKVVSEDETEKGIRAILNLGHTFGHAIEAHFNYKGVLHGEGVAIGTSMAARLSQALGYITADDVSAIDELLRSANLPVISPENIEIERMLSFMRVDKKADNGDVRFIVLQSIGCAKLESGINVDLVGDAMTQCMPNIQQASSQD